MLPICGCRKEEEARQAKLARGLQKKAEYIKTGTEFINSITSQLAEAEAAVTLAEAAQVEADAKVRVEEEIEQDEAHRLAVRDKTDFVAQLKLSSSIGVQDLAEVIAATVIQFEEVGGEAAVAVAQQLHTPEVAKQIDDSDVIALCMEAKSTVDQYQSYEASAARDVHAKEVGESAVGVDAAGVAEDVTEALRRAEAAEATTRKEMKQRYAVQLAAHLRLSELANGVAGLESFVALLCDRLADFETFVTALTAKGADIGVTFDIPGSIPVGKPEGYKRGEAEIARGEAQTARNALSEAKRRVEDLKRSTGRDFGPSNEWAPLRDQCFSLTAGQYKYEVRACRCTCRGSDRSLDRCWVDALWMHCFLLYCIGCL